MHLVYRIKQLILVFGDFLTFSVGFYLALAARHGTLPQMTEVQRHALLFATTFFLWIIVNYINNLYDLGKISNSRFFYRRMSESAGIAFVAGIIFFYIVPSRDITPKTILLLTVLIGYGLSTLWRLFAFKIFEVKKLQTAVLFVGYTPEVHELVQILQKPKRGYVIHGVVENDPLRIHNLPKELPILPSVSTLKSHTYSASATVVVIAPHIQADLPAMQEIYQLLFSPVQIVNLVAFYETITGRIPPSVFSEAWFLEHLQRDGHTIYEKWQTCVDYITVLLLGPVFLFFLPWIALAIRLTSHGPVFFQQERIGRYGKKFMLCKFRSMYALSPDGSAEVNGYQFATKDDTRITPVGKFLRRTRLDELPQLWNVLKRDISIIGPRPERPEIVEKLTQVMLYYPLRHIVRPGLTGWAVLHQHYADTYEKSLEKLQYDLYYIKNRSVLVDLTILLRTVNVIFRLMGQ